MARPGSWLRSPAATVLLAADNGDRGTVGAPAPAQETLSRQRRTGSCSQMIIYPASSRRWHKCTLSSGSVNASFRLYLQCYGGSIQPPASVSRCAMQMLECCLHPPHLSTASPVQPSPDQPGSAQISRAKFLGMEFINQMGLSPLQPELATSHRPPGPAWRGLYKEIV